MSEKRRDSRKRILHTGESQLSDGRYMFKYIDLYGSTKYVYSWRLDKNDPLPKGKRKDISLREKERQIEADIFDQIVPNGGGLTVLTLSERYISLKTGVRHNTEANYNTVLNLLRKEAFGKMRIDRVKLSDAKDFLIKLQKDGKGYSTIKSVRGVLRPAFQMALDDDLIRKNPFSFQLATVVYNDSIMREAISVQQERKFLEFVKGDAHYCRYYEAFYILFHTGMRISEFCGLTVSDIDMKQKVIHVTHQLQRRRTMEYVIEETKTKSGTRDIPMMNDVYDCFKKILENRKPPKVEPMIDGHTGFLFLDKNEQPMVSLHWERYMVHAVAKYNGIYRIQLPKITPAYMQAYLLQQYGAFGNEP